MKPKWVTLLFLVGCEPAEKADTGGADTEVVGCVSNIEEMQCPGSEGIYWACDNCGTVWSCRNGFWSDNPSVHPCGCVTEDGHLDSERVECQGLDP